MPVELVAAASRRIVCRIPFSLKDMAKRSGFRWDPEARHWWTTTHVAANDLIEQCYASHIDIRVDASARKIIEDAKKSVDLSCATQATVSIPAPEGLDYLPYQRAGIQYAMSRRNVLIGDEMGLGKTIQAIGVINADKRARSVLVITPASLKPNWKRELTKWLV